MLGREGHVTEDVEGDPVEVGAQEAGLGAVALDARGELAAHAAFRETVRGGLAQVFVDVGDTLERADVDGIGGVVVGIRPGVRIHGAYPGVVLPGALAGVGRRLLDRPVGADQLRGAAVADLQVGGLVRDKVEVEFRQTGNVARLILSVDRFGGRIRGVERQRVQVVDARREQQGARDGRCDMFYARFHGFHSVFRS